VTLTIEDMITRFGPLAVLIGAAVEGEVTMLLAGVAAHLGLLDFTGAM
jgi:membrane protein DedA with SNARE-associated domain